LSGRDPAGTRKVAETRVMRDETMSRSWKIAVAASVAGAGALAFGLFLAIGKDTLADDKVKVVESSGDNGVKVVRVVSGDDGQAAAMAYAEADSAARGGFLGVDTREYTKSDDGGAYVETVVEGDVIVGFNGEVVRGPGKLGEKIRATKPGEKIKLDVRRDGKPVALQVDMGDRPKPMIWGWSNKSGDFGALSEEQQKAVEKSLKDLDDKMPQLQNLGKMKMRHFFFNTKPLLGVEMVETTPELRETMGGSKEAGVLVGKVLPGSAAEKAGVRVGDLILSVDGTKVADAGDLGDAIREREGKTVDLDLVRDKKTMHLKANLPKIDEPDDQPTGPRASRWFRPSGALRRLEPLKATLRNLRSV
jgi:hypothetical protein